MFRIISSTLCILVLVSELFAQETVISVPESDLNSENPPVAIQKSRLKDKSHSRRGEVIFKLREEKRNTVRRGRRNATPASIQERRKRYLQRSERLSKRKRMKSASPMFTKADGGNHRERLFKASIIEGEDLEEIF